MKSGTKRYVGYMWVVHWEDVGIMLILSPETSHILSVLPLHNSTHTHIREFAPSPFPEGSGARGALHYRFLPDAAPQCLYTAPSRSLTHLFLLTGRLS